MEKPQTAGIVLVILVLVFAAAVTARHHPTGSGPLFGSSNSGSGSTSGTQTNTKDIQHQLTDAQKQAAKIQKEIDQEKARQEASTLTPDVRFSASGASATDPQREYVEFTLNARHAGKVLISGFTLESTATGKSAIIGNAVPLVFAGQINQSAPIYISPGDRVVVVTGQSPLGYSFQVNECTGYLTQYQQFTPTISLQCPRANTISEPQAPNNLSDTCLNTLDRIPRCTLPKASTLKYSTLDESRCSNFITNNLTYGACVTAGKNDLNFYSHEWRIYLGRTAELWKSSRETIKLIDLSGKTVGTVTR